MDMTPFPTVDDILDGVNRAEDKMLPLEYADAATVSVSIDQVDVNNPNDDVVGISVVVYQGKLFSLSIADDWLAEPDVLTTMLNAVITQTFYRYSQEYQLNVENARAFIEEHERGEDVARQELRARINELLEN